MREEGVWQAPSYAHHPSTHIECTSILSHNTSIKISFFLWNISYLKGEKVLEDQIKSWYGKCKCRKQMASSPRALISASHLRSSDDLGAICSHHFQTSSTSSSSPSASPSRDGFGGNVLTIHTIFLKCEIHMSGIIFVSFPSLLVLQYWLPTKVICEGALIHGTLVVTNDWQSYRQ